LWDCIKRKSEPQSAVNYLLEMIANSFMLITKDILGPIMIAIIAFMMKLVQVMTQK
jgi:hypothetical protein